MSHADSVRASTYSVIVPTNKVLIEDTFQLTRSHPKEKTRKVWRHRYISLVQILQVEELYSMRAVQAAIDDAKSVVRTPWLARTQWLERYVGVDMVKLVEMTE